MTSITYTLGGGALILLLIGLGILASLIVWIVRCPRSGLGMLAVLIVLAAAGVFSIRAVVSTDRHKPAIVFAPMTAPIPPTPVPSAPLIDLPLPAATVPAGATSQPAGISGKAWVDDWVGFVNASGDSGKTWIRVESPGYCATEHEAHLAAQRAAVDSLKPFIEARLTSRLSGTPLKIAIDDRWLEQQLAASLSGERVVRDRFVHRVQRPYGDVWREMVLIDASPQTIDMLAAQCAAAARQEAMRTVSGWGAVAAVVVVIMLAYAFLNAATRGYLVWRLRAIAVLAIIVALLAAMAMA
ncbi:hypothetical protein [Fontivita pretiosa]|uniref:hypothetical protein n=1 Tax=Fontivita pretiosa TaxID=2989684 RepID=UPI003D187024